MLYLSTRGHADRKRFCDILLEGLAPDGGLYLPVEYPQISDAKLTQLRTTLRGNATYAVVKNTLTDLAAKEAGVTAFEGQLAGPTAIASKSMRLATA